ncbi:unnamed protein product [Rhodiola kirilowii]
MDSSRCCCYMLFFIILSTINSVACSASSFSKENNERDRMALVALRDDFIAGGTPPNGIGGGAALSSWNASLHFCEWQGITCGKRHKRVIAIELIEEKLNGVVSSSIGNLTFLRVLFLTNNSLHGEIPKQIGQLWRLQKLSLAGNSFEGRIPVELSNCSNILSISLRHNNLTGRIPFQFASLSKIQLFNVNQNNLVGEMPSFLRNFSSLISLDLRFNYFHGEVGDSLQGLAKLKFLKLAGNSFSGMISQLYNLSNLDTLEIHNNYFIGTLAQDMDVSFPKLTWFSITNNSFTGTIPPSLSNMSGLTVCQMGSNKLRGCVPDDLGKLKNLSLLQLYDNSLGSRMPNDLSFVDSLTNCTKLEYLDLGKNMFSGSLSESIGNFTSALQQFTIRQNHITGPIPERIGELSGLSVVDFRRNILTGTIPTSIGKLTKVSLLYLGSNSLHGEIPSSIGNLTNLLYLNLSSNSLDGLIPITLGNCKVMQTIDVSNNHLTGNLQNDMFTQFKDLILCDLSHNSFHGTIITSVFEDLKNLFYLDASYNRISGEISAQLDGLFSLEYLLLAGNSFKGSIPPSLGNLRGLIYLDLSNNSLSGAIPKELTYIGGLQYLNLSFNQLEGEVPWFKNVIQLSVTGNENLCGGNSELKLQPCLRSRTGKAFSRKVIIGITLSALGSFFVLLLLFIIICIRRKRKKGNIDGSNKGYQRVTYAELFKATENFAVSNLVGTGSFGDVYRGILDDGTERKPIAVKVLNLSKHGATRSFTSECKVLRRIRHRNLLRIITSCSSLDHKGNDFKALVFNFMSNGNLDSWLHFSEQQHGETRDLTLAKRVEIAIDVGCALDYLHNGCETPIIHCDLKPSNILLDDDMVAHVGDFGLAKLLHGVTGNLSGCESLSTAIKGSIGYVAPEYGMGATISAQGDTYSYGIVLLELITGKRPTDDMFNNGMSLRSFCERAISSDHVHVEVVIDQRLVNELHEVATIQKNSEQIKLKYQTVLVSFVEIGISCSAESSKDRMDIQSAVKCLERIKEKCSRV